MRDYAIGPVPTPNPPAGVSYTPQLAGGQIYNQGGTGNADQMWNEGWNVGFNNPTKSASSYFGGQDQNWSSGFAAGVAEYNKRNSPSTSKLDVGTNKPVTTQPQTTNFDSIYASMYPGWDRTAAEQDWIAKGRPTGGSGGGGGFDANQAAINAARNAFNNAYAPLFAQLDAMAGLIPQQQQQREQGIQNMYGSQVGEIQGARDSAMAGLDVSKQQVAQRQAKSVRDLQENMRNLLQAGNIQLGVGGAGDSSAKDMLSFALSKAAGRSGADISNQAQAMYTDIDMLGNQIKATYDDNLAKLATWRDNNLSEVTKWAQEMLMNIESQKATARGQQAAALAANETNIINNALSRLQQIDDQVSTWNKGIQEWALNRMAQIDDAKAKISGYGKYTPGQITAQELQGLGDFSTITNNTLLGYNPWSKQKDEMTNFLSNYGR